MELVFRNRCDAGEQLGQFLRDQGFDGHFIVLGLARGGVPVAAEVARQLHAHLDVYVVRKLGLPGQEELAMGAIGSGGVIVLQPSVIAHHQVDQATIQAVAERERQELARRLNRYRQGNESYDLAGRDVLIVDDGLATGSTMRAAVAALRLLEPKSIHVAVPVAAAESRAELAALVDSVHSLIEPVSFGGIGQFYRDFSQTTDEEVSALLAKE